MSVETAIINYLRNESKGVINLSDAQAKKIIEFITSPKENAAIAKLYKYSSIKSQYELMMSIKTTDTDLEKSITDALKTPPTDFFYMYDCYNSKGQFEGKIFSIHSNIF